MQRLLLSVSVALVAAAVSAAPCEQYPFYWNVAFKADVSQYDIVPANHTQTGDGCTTAGCKPWSQGLWPTIAADGSMTNGGVPQAGNLTAHLDYIRTHISSWIPDPAWDGNAVFDFEDWTPIWIQNSGSGSWHSRAYQNYSYKLVKEAHPTWNFSQIYKEAQVQFETAALNWMVQTLRVVKELRPNVKTGFYGLPANPFYPCLGASGQHPQCGYRFPVVGKVMQAENDAIQALWNESTALFPSIYVPPHELPLDTESYINGTVAEAARLAAVTENSIPVYAFMWSYYHNGTTHLDPQDLHSSLALPHYNGADGVVIWGDPREHEADFTAYLKAQLGPECKALTEQFCPTN